MILTIEKEPKFSIKLFHKNLLEVTKHILMNISFEQLCFHSNHTTLDITFDFINEKNIELLQNTVYKLKDLKYICKKTANLI